MSAQEKELIKKVDNIILNSSTEKLSEIQKLDKETQLIGNSFYDIYVNSFQNKNYRHHTTKPQPYSKGK